MTRTIRDLERDIEESRARLDLTIDRIQDKLSVSGVVDDVLGSIRRNNYGFAFDHAVAVIRRNPVPVMLVAAGVGWLFYRMAKEPMPLHGTRVPSHEAEIPVLNTGHARIYDPDTSPLHPMQDTLESRREMNARA